MPVIRKLAKEFEQTSTVVATDLLAALYHEFHLLTLLHNPEELIHKVVEWMLREICKLDKQMGAGFLNQKYLTMHRTMLRYTIEKFPASELQLLLKKQARFYPHQFSRSAFPGKHLCQWSYPQTLIHNPHLYISKELKRKFQNMTSVEEG